MYQRQPPAVNCLICGASMEAFMSFGRMPIANGFLRSEDFDQEFFFELKIGFCTTCNMVQLTELIDKERLFHDQYAYFSSISTHMAEHFRALASEVKQNYLTTNNPFVLEIGSNDGILLRHFVDDTLRHLGVEPSANVAKAAKDRGIQTMCTFFDEDVAQKIRDKYGPADVVLGTNVMCHIADIHTVVRGIELLLKPDGVLIFEDPYIGDIIQKTAYDQIYDEHVFYFSVASLNNLFSQYGMTIIDISPQEVHGGSMRYTVARKATRPVNRSVYEQKAVEDRLGLGRSETYAALRKRIERSRHDLVSLLQAIKSEGRTIVGYGATSKSTTITNYCGIGPKYIDFISDTTPNKQGKYSPGVHIPIRAYDQFVAARPDYALLFAWNHRKEILAKEKGFTENGGKWIVYVPSVEILS